MRVAVDAFLENQDRLNKATQRTVIGHTDDQELADVREDSQR